jgi:hypothetical protein
MLSFGGSCDFSISVFYSVFIGLKYAPKEWIGIENREHRIF